MRRLAVLFAIFMLMPLGIASAQDSKKELPYVQVHHQFDWLQPTTGPERTVLFMGYHVTFFEIGRFNFGGIGIGMGLKRMSPDYPYVPESRQVELHPLITSHFGYRLMEDSNFWVNVSYMYDPVRKANMIGFGFSASPWKTDN